MPNFWNASRKSSSVFCLLHIINKPIFVFMKKKKIYAKHQYVYVMNKKEMCVLTWHGRIIRALCAIISGWIFISSIRHDVMCEWEVFFLLSLHFYMIFLYHVISPSKCIVFSFSTNSINKFGIAIEISTF